MNSMSNRCTVYFVRPGATFDNTDGRWSSEDDTPLSTSGLQAARTVSKELALVQFNAAYCSKAKRTQQTANLILGGSMVPSQVDCLYEMAIGPFEGREPTEIVRIFKETTGYPDSTTKKTLPKLWERKNGEEPTANECLLDRGWHPEIDNFDDFCGRIEGKIRNICRENLGNTILMVGHGTPGKLLIALAENKHVIDIECKKGCYFKVIFSLDGSISLDRESMKDVKF